MMPLPSRIPAPWPIWPLRQGGLAASGAPRPLEDDATEVRRLRRRDDGAAPGASAVTQVEETLEELFAGFGGDGLEHRATPDRDEKEETPTRGAKLGRQAMDRGQIVQRLFAHESVDLERQPHRGTGPRGHEGPIEAAVYPAQGVVAGRVRAVQAEGDGLHSSRLEPRDDSCVQERRGARRHRYAEAAAPRRGDESEQVGALERIAARQDQMGQRRSELRQLRDEAQSFLRIQLGGIGLGRGLGAAVAAREITGPRHLPVHAPGCPVEAQAPVHARRSRASSLFPISTYARFPDPR